MPRWVLDSLLSMLCFGAWAVIGRSVAHVDPALSQALSTAGILPIMICLALTAQFCIGTRKRAGSLWALGAGTMVGVGNLAYYHALAAGESAAMAASLTALYPLATVLLAFLLLRETPHLWQVVGIGGSLVAMLLFSVAEKGSAATPWMAWGLASIALWGGSALLQKRSTEYISAERSAFFFLAAFIPLAVLLLTVDVSADAGSGWSLGWKVKATWRELQVLAPRDWIWLALLGATYGLGNLFLLAAFRHGGKASVVTPLSALYPVVAIPLALVFLQEKVGPRQWVGIAVAVLSGLALSWERRPPTTTPSPPIQARSASE